MMLLVCSASGASRWRTATCDGTRGTVCNGALDGGDSAGSPPEPDDVDSPLTLEIYALGLPPVVFQIRLAM
jgi:hypothetical protein